MGIRDTRMIVMINNKERKCLGERQDGCRAPIELVTRYRSLRGDLYRFVLAQHQAKSFRDKAVEFDVVAVAIIGFQSDNESWNAASTGCHPFCQSVPSCVACGGVFEVKREIDLVQRRYHGIHVIEIALPRGSACGHEIFRQTRLTTKSASGKLTT